MKNFLMMTVLLASPLAHAVTCQTFSNGLNFSGYSLQGSQARADALRNCTSDSRTVNADCNANLACDDTYANPIIECNTFSNGLNFSMQGRDPSQTGSRVLAQCSQDSRTVNADCNANLSCGGSGAPVIECSTFSNGLNFAISGRDPRQSSQRVIAQCSQDSRTVNADCNANISCGGAGAPVIQCSTFSNGLNFSISGRDPVQSTQRVVAMCTQDSRTANAQCNANASCTGGVYPQPQPYPQPYPQPQPPRPRPDPRPRPGQLCIVRPGADASGRPLFRVLGPSGAILGTFYTAQEAESMRRYDSRCFR